MGGAFLASRDAIECERLKKTKEVDLSSKGAEGGRARGALAANDQDRNPARTGAWAYSLANSKPLDDPTVSLDVLTLQVVQKASALSHELQ